MKAVLVLVVLLSGSNSLPQYLKPCHLTKPDFNKCALEHANYAIPHLVKGDKTYGIPLLHPFKLPLVEIEENNFKLTMKNLNVFGLKDAVAKNINLNKTNAELTLYIPKLNFIGDYAIQGKVLFFNVQGSGAVNVTAVGDNFIIRSVFKKLTKNGKKFLQLSHPKVTMKLERCYFNFENLLNKEDTGIDINKILNDNWEEFLLNIDSSLQETVSSIIESAVNKLLEKTPEKDVFPD